MNPKYVALIGMLEKDQNGQKGVTNFIYTYSDSQKEIGEKLHEKITGIESRMKEDGIDAKNFEHYVYNVSEDKIDVDSKQFEKTKSYNEALKLIRE